MIYGGKYVFLCESMLILGVVVAEGIPFLNIGDFCS